MNSKLKKQNILITGGSGFFGNALCRYLIGLNRQYSLEMNIYAMARTPVITSGIHFISHDVLNEFQSNIQFDSIIHAATPVVNDKSTPENLLDIIVNGTQNIAQFALKNGCKNFLLVSSGAVYGNLPSDQNFFEEDYFGAVPFFSMSNPYASGKRISEVLIHNMLRNSEMNYTIARGFAFSGEGLALDQHFAIGNFVRDAVDNGVINVKGDGSAIRSYMDSWDLGHWLMTILLFGERGEAYNLGSDQEISIKDLAYKVAQYVPGTTVNIQNSTGENIKSNRYVPSIVKAKKELHLELKISLEESIKIMIENYRK